VESFKADDVPGGKAFVRGGTINPDAKQPISESTPPPSKFMDNWQTQSTASVNGLCLQ